MKHLKKNILVVLLFAVLLNFGVGINNDCLLAVEPEKGQNFSDSRNHQKNSANPSYTVTAPSDELLGKYENSNREFIKSEIGNKIVYFHQRKISEAIVEKDFIVYQFDKDTKKLINKKAYWRKGLPEQVIPRVTQEGAELMAEGDILSTKIYIISPESNVFPLTPIPKNPCWIVKSIKNENIIISIIDAMEGTKLGYGIPPPYNGFSLSGPWQQNPCTGSWDRHFQSAKKWFNKMGYPTHAVIWPTRSEIKGSVQDPQILLFYELAHGSSYYFAGGCNNDGYVYTTAKNIEKWIASYPKKIFVFLGSCEGMCYTGDDSLSYEFRKGSSINTVTVGYCEISSEACDNCWINAVDWQEQLFSYMCQGYTIKEAFDLALADYPMCLGGCVRFAGDESFTIETFIYPPLNFTGEKVENKSLLQKEYINVLKWESNSLNYSIDSYRIYEIEEGNWNLIEELGPSDFEYWHRKLEKDKKYTYALVSVCCNKESPPIYVEID